MSVQITGRTGGRPATVSDYDALFTPAERPRKFSAEEVGFTVLRGAPLGCSVCNSCRHWFVNNASNRIVCEIMRLPDESNVPGDGVCRFWNIQDGVFPLLKVL
jgi:hypothetical protein